MYGCLEKLIEKKVLRVREDGMLERNGHLTIESPWHHVVIPNKDCGIWHEIIKIKKFVPSKCQECWKIVVRPKTLKQLFALLELQQQLGIPSKCGIEKREIVHGLYGGYFYNDSLEEGLDCYKKVRGAVDERLGTDIQVILKRACTEFELACGDSRNWKIIEEQKDIEELVEKYVLKYPEDYQKQSHHTLELVHASWIQWAYQNGDETYKEYSEPLYPPPVTYH